MALISLLSADAWGQAAAGAAARETLTSGDLVAFLLASTGEVQNLEPPARLPE